ncbi:protein pangolin, isoforms A/H/I/S isoform X2 [Nomia melanderi]|uniref:protein pangolin, isoforms A/H/I/S isoform X2 n=1 Tax=Nomia melanderi TaxID=2448451 RepID=UPI003FCC41D8
MPHVSSSGGGDDLGSEDEVKVFKDEGEDEKRSSENLTEEKSSLIDLTESEEKGSLAGGSYATTGKTSTRSDLSPVFGKVDPTPHTSSFNMGYLVSPYPYPNGAGGPIPVSMASKMGLAGTHPSGLPFFCPNGDHLTQPPPAHMGIPPYGTLDAGKAAAAAGEYWSSATPGQPPPTHPEHWKRLLAAAASTGLTRAPMYPFSTGQYPYPMLSPEMTQVAASWHTPSMYPISPASAGFRSPYPTSLPITSSSLPSDLYRFSPTGLMPPHPGLSPHAHALTSHALVPSTPKTDHSSLDHNHRSTVEQKNSASLVNPDNGKSVDSSQQNNQDKKKPHIKKPLNAFMLYMKEMRAKVVAECTLKESAAINQILGRRWHSLSREEQARYYEAARQERHLHQQRYPGWSARDNYGYGSKKKKRKKERSADPTGGNNMKKCRARYGLDQQSQWCKPCRRKKKCIRYMGEGGDGDGEGDGEGEDDHSEDNLGSVGEAGTPEEDESLSSPGGLSALSSLASPSLVLPSPSSLASPCPCPLTPPVPPPPLSNNPANSQPHNQPAQPPPPHRNPVGTNPHDINNPLSVNQLTGQCIKSEVVPAPSGTSNPAISVT